MAVAKQAGCGHGCLGKARIDVKRIAPL